MPTLCPICNKDDEIRKVSAIVSAGQSSGVFSGPAGDGGYTMLSGSSSTKLARMLAPPPAPKHPGGSASALLIVFIIVILFLCIGPGVALIWSQPTGLLATGQLELGPQTIGLFLVFIGVFWLLPVVVGGYLGIARRKAKYAAEKPPWDRAIEKHRRLYFCFRDDIVFDPKTGETCQPQALIKFLYSTR